MQEDYEQPFKETILMYNDQLQQACKEYGVSYINSRILEEENCQNPVMNYISKKPPFYLSREIIYQIASRLGQGENFALKKCQHPEVKDNGALGVQLNLHEDVYKARKMKESSSGYQKEVFAAKEEEHKREEEVFAKVYQKSRKRI